MKKLMIDLDETICEGGYLEAVNEYLHTDYQYTDIFHMDNFHIRSSIQSYHVQGYT